MDGKMKIWKVERHNNYPGSICIDYYYDETGKMTSDDVAYQVDMENLAQDEEFDDASWYEAEDVTHQFKKL